MKMVEAKNKKHLSNCSSDAAAVAALLPSAPPAARPLTRAGFAFVQKSQLYSDIIAFLTLLEVLAAVRSFLLYAPLPSKPVETVREIQRRRLLLRQVDRLFFLVTRSFLRLITQSPYKRLRIQKKLVKFFSVITTITHKGKLLLQPVTQWLMQFWKLLAKIAELQKLWRKILFARKDEVLLSVKRARAPTQFPEDDTLKVHKHSRFWLAFVSPRAQRAPALALPAGVAGSG